MIEENGVASNGEDAKTIELRVPEEKYLWR